MIIVGEQAASSNGKKQSIWKWKGEDLTKGIEGDILMMVDMEGDWREELITALPGELRIYHTVIPAKDASCDIDARPALPELYCSPKHGRPAIAGNLFIILENN